MGLCRFRPAFPAKDRKQLDYRRQGFPLGSLLMAPP